MSTLAKMKIADIRSVINSAQWARGWYTGGTSEEFRRQQVGPAIAKHVEALKALQIPARFVADIADRAKEIERCEALIARWNAAQTEQPKPEEKRHAFLGGFNCVRCDATRDSVQRCFA